MKRFQWPLYAVLGSASAGVLWTSALASVEIRDNAYVSLGLPGNAGSTFLNGIVAGALGGALAGMVLYATVVAFRFVWGVALLDHARRWLPYLLCMSVALIAVGAGHTVARGSFGHVRTWSIIATAMLWCGLFALGRWRLVAERTVLSTFVTTNLFVVPALTLAMTFFTEPGRTHLVRRPEMFIGATAVFAVCWLTVWRVASTDPIGVGKPPWLLTVPAFFPPILLAVAPMLLEPGLSYSRPVNVVLIGIDTLRVDHTSLLDGSKRDTTPHLAALAERGTFFENAISHAPWTMPSFASIMTGRYPREHGADSFSGYLRPAELTLAELMREAGFDTAGIVSHLFVDADHGFAQGFDAYDESNVRGAEVITSADVTDLALEYLHKRSEEPFFLFLHYFDPHYEYVDHPEFDYADDYQGWLRGGQLKFIGLRERRHELSSDDLDYLRNLYDEEIAYTDAQVGRVLTYLQESGLEDNTIVVVVSDHGEEFMERGWLGHTISLYEEQIHVPLIIALPPEDEQIARVTSQVETRAILATLLDVMRPTYDTGGLQGSLLPLMKGSLATTFESPAFSEVWLRDSHVNKGQRISSLRTDSWKLTKNFTQNEEHLYNLAIEPSERTNLLEGEPEQARRLRGLLEDWLRSMDERVGEAPTVELTEEEIRQLRSLGYVR